MLQISGAGDELQGIKRGIMEMADMMVITKADGENIHKAELAKTQYQGALRLFPVPESGWRRKSIPARHTQNGTRGGVERRRRVPRLHSGERILHAQPQPSEQVLDVRNHRRGVEEQLLPQPADRTPHHGARAKSARAKVSSFVAAHELLELYFKTRTNGPRSNRSCHTALNQTLNIT